MEIRDKPYTYCPDNCPLQRFYLNETEQNYIDFSRENMYNSRVYSLECENKDCCQAFLKIMTDPKS